jgi:hypothetical protein
MQKRNTERRGLRMFKGVSRDFGESFGERRGELEGKGEGEFKGEGAKC